MKKVCNLIGQIKGKHRLFFFVSGIVLGAYFALSLLFFDNFFYKYQNLWVISLLFLPFYPLICIILFSVWKYIKQPRRYNSPEEEASFFKEIGIDSTSILSYLFGGMAGTFISVVFSLIVIFILYS